MPPQALLPINTHRHHSQVLAPKIVCFESVFGVRNQERFAVARRSFCRLNTLYHLRISFSLTLVTSTTQFTPFLAIFTTHLRRHIQCNPEVFVAEVVLGAAKDEGGGEAGVV